MRNLKILVALRTNIFEHLDFGAANGGQEEKYRSLVLPMNWTKEQLQVLVDERIRVASGKQGADAESLISILPHQNPKRGSAFDYLIERTLLRPRDLLAFVRECLVHSEGKTQVSWDAIKRAEIGYSEARLLALRDEWKLNYPGIDRVFETFRHANGKMSRSDVQERLDECIMLLAESGFTGEGWLAPLGDSVLEGVAEKAWEKRYGPMLRMLYSIGFLGVASQSRKNPTFYIEDPNALKFDRQLESLDAYFVARAYHSALEVITSD